MKHNCGALITEDQTYCKACSQIITTDLINNINERNSISIQAAMIYIGFAMMIISFDGLLASLGIVLFIAGIIFRKNNKIKPEIKLPESIDLINMNILSAIHLKNGNVRNKEKATSIILVIASLFLFNDYFAQITAWLVIVFITLFAISKSHEIKIAEPKLSERSQFPILISTTGVLLLIKSMLLWFNSINSMSVYADYIYRNNIARYYQIGLYFNIIGIIIYYIQPPNSIRVKNDDKLSLVIFFAGVLFYMINSMQLQGLWTLLITISAVLKLSFPTTIDKKSLNTTEKTSTTLKQVKAKQFTSSIKNQPYIQNRGILSTISDRIEEYDEKHFKIKKSYDSIVDEIENTLPREIDVLENEDLTPLEKRNKLLDMKSTIKRVGNSIKYWENQWTQLRTDFDQSELEKELEQLENKIRELKSQIPELRDKIDNNSQSLYKQSSEELLGKLDDISEKHNTIYEQFKYSEIEQSSKIKSLAPNFETVKYKKKNDTSFKFRSLLSEKLLNNLFAYIGALFAVIGFFFILILTYDNFILVNFPKNASKSTASLGIVMLYGVAALFSVNNIIIGRFTDKLVSLSRFLSSIGIVLFQLGFYIQSIYFTNLDLNAYFLLIPGFLLVILTCIAGYLMRSRIISLTGISIGMYISFISGSPTQVANKLIRSETVIGFSEIGPIIIFMMNIVLLVLTIFLILKRRIWIPLAVYSLFSPVMWLLISDNIASPDILALFIAISNLTIILANKMPTPKPFANFMALFFLIYNNFISILFTIKLLETVNTLSIFQMLSIIFVFSVFYSMYWIFVIVEKDLSVSFELSRSFDFTDQNINLTPIQGRLNWLMLSSLVFIFVIVNALANNNAGQLIIYFAIVLTISAIVGIKANLNKIVKNSIILMLFEAEIVYLMSLNGPHVNQLSTSIISAIFLVIYLSVFRVLANYNPDLSILGIKLSTYRLAMVIAFVSIFNFIIAAESEQYGILVLLLSSISWLVIGMSLIYKGSIDRARSRFIKSSIFSGLIYQFIYALLRQKRRFPIEEISNEMSFQIHLVINLSIGIYIITAVILTYFGVQMNDTTDVEFNTTFMKNINIADKLRQIMRNSGLYLPQIIIFTIPSILIVFGAPYFYYPISNQAIMILYFILYFFLLPLLAFISEKRENSAFGPLAALTGYFAFIGGFVLLGGAKKLYDIIVQPPASNVRGVYFITPEWAIFIIVAVFIVSVTAVLRMNNRSIKIVNPSSLIESTEEASL